MLPSKDLRYRTQLCKHGKEHGTEDPDCSYAHSLCDLRLASPELQDFWKDRKCDRWVGQDLDPCRVERIKKYYNDSLLYDRPVWSKGVIWWYNNRELDDFQYEPWDFGLEGDGSMYLGRTKWCRGLWNRLQERRKALIKSYAQPTDAESPKPPSDSEMSS